MLKNVLIFSDLDGTLLDHHTYSFAPALSMLQKLRSANIPVIPNTSKTFAELTELTQQIGLDGPFIVENGAAVLTNLVLYPYRIRQKDVKNVPLVKVNLPVFQFRL